MATTFQQLYENVLKSVGDKDKGGFEKSNFENFDAYPLDCLLHPHRYAPVWRMGDCDCDTDGVPRCVASCIFKAISRDKDGHVSIDKDLCVGCSACIDSCETKKLTESRDLLPVLEAIKNAKGPVFALVAPAFIGQFHKSVTPGKLRSAFKEIGFAGMVEVALFADILTLKEALEFDKKILDNKDFMITSCCCPIWIAMLRKVYQQLLPFVPDAVSPMIASGRAIKLLEPDSITVFIGPCIAKKAEARESDVADAVDFVLTFREIQDLFDVFEIDLTKMADDPREHSSWTGRIYARTGGVSEAVKGTVNRLNPNREITVRAQQADGVPACKKLLNTLLEGEIPANFLEGMGCVGGCVGGPKAIIAREEGRDNVEEYSKQAAHLTPLDNPYVLDLLKRLGIDTVEELLEETRLLTRRLE